ncbi:nucleotidyltransferase domain-containing protein [Candidatus Sulfurimonas marisnigri]|uniref:Nucleotidyltransferase domain-containing protein n=1 Tax=Candidatus Sulfurimonas marisnigri TaxID=2740405 RepID=A0A7S7LZ31_9BACT|nr:nucleotidyltransferase domain-containing protein [Candidatus Sulfurimonas marisnigri]QOY54052.1 nucleotidyltransferase domain-containing protein [Candidatus Sulfurimonas marisnigri]
MRLSKEEITLLKNKLYELSSDARLYLFGSRVDDTRRGGDIDLLILSDKLRKKDLRKLRLSFFEKFGEQKMDIVIDDGTLTNPFTKLIFQKAVLL